MGNQFLRYKKKETDFETTRVWYDYLQNIEDIIENLRENIDVEWAEKEIKEYKRKIRKENYESLDPSMQIQQIKLRDIKFPTVVSKKDKETVLQNALELEIIASGNLGSNNYQRGLEEIMLFHF